MERSGIEGTNSSNPYLKLDVQVFSFVGLQGLFGVRRKERKAKSKSLSLPLLPSAQPGAQADAG